MAQENKYHIKHKRQTLADFQKDIHRFTYWYNGQKTVSCVSAQTVIFDEEDAVPENVKLEIQSALYRMIDANEGKWSVPKGAREIADAYCTENFC